MTKTSLEAYYAPGSQDLLIAQRRQLVATPCTLNGHPAQIVGVASQWATVVDHMGLSAQWSWEAATRIMNKGGAFNSN